MANGILQLDKNYVQLGLGTLTFTVPATVSSLKVPVVAIPFSVRCSVTVPCEVAPDNGAGTGRDLGFGMLGGSKGAPIALELTLGDGQTGLGSSFPNVQANSAPGIDPTLLPETTPNLPSIAPGFGVTGLGSGQTIDDDSRDKIAYAAVASGLVITVSNGANIQVSPVLSDSQGAQQFKFTLLCTAADTVTVVFSSGVSSDQLSMQGIKANVSIEQGA